MIGSPAAARKKRLQRHAQGKIGERKRPTSSARRGIGAGGLRPTCNKTQRMIFDAMKANDKNDPDAADIICDECKSIIATLHGPRAHRAGARTDRIEKARAMAGQEIDRLSDPSATEEERQRRKRRLLKGPKEFRDARSNRPKFK